MDEKNLVPREKSELTKLTNDLAKRGLQLVDEFQPIETGLTETEVFPFIEKVNEILRSVGSPPEEFLNGKITNPHDVRAFDINRFLEVFDRINIQSGYELDYVYTFDGQGGEPLVYAREVNASPLTSPDEYYERFSLSRHDMLLGEEATHDDSFPYLAHLQFENIPVGCFQFALFCMTVRRFYLFWHSNYNDRKYMLTKTAVKQTVTSLELDIQKMTGQGSLLPAEAKILNNVSYWPRVKTLGKSSTVTLFNYKLNLGYSYLRVYLKHPNIFERIEDECIIKSKIETMF
jgi:hypothetical protein